ncbi:MAG: formate dehydrogenase accessory sulfurtransferase FdhD [Pseudomonadota bacterium]
MELDLTPSLPPPLVRLPVWRSAAAPDVELTDEAMADAPRDSAAAAQHDAVAAEVPVALVYNGISHAVMLASPIDLEDFALGFSLAEGLIDSVDDLLDCEITPHTLAGGVEGLALELRVTLRCFMRLKDKRRSLLGRSGCGLCGIETLNELVRPLDRPALPAVAVTPAALQRAMHEMSERQQLHQATGASHAAAFCALDGRVLALREDIGCHNAVDKLTGWLARSGQAPEAGFICVTSRASYEIVHKVAQAGVGLLAAIYAPTALAIRTAEAAGLCLLGFVRGERAAAYSRPAGLMAGRAS